MSLYHIVVSTAAAYLHQSHRPTTAANRGSNCFIILSIQHGDSHYILNQFAKND